MSFDEQEVLGRFHRALVREIRAKTPEAVTSPFTVAEIYQDLVPYRTHRDTIGVEMNADYEHALLRLLAGEGDYLSIESTTARQEIREELDSANPNTGLYRDFAAADVRLNPLKLDIRDGEDEADDGWDEGGEAVEGGEGNEGRMDVVLQGPPGVGNELHEESDSGETGTGDGVGVQELEGEEAETEAPPEAYDRLEIEPVGADLGPVETSGTGEVASEAIPSEVSPLHSPPAMGGTEDEGEEKDLPPFENCPWCREKLPQRARVRFCPFCGSNVRLVPCPACGEELELTWRFCIACGTEVES